MCCCGVVCVVVCVVCCGVVCVACQRCVRSRRMARMGASSRSIATSGSGHNVLFAVVLFVVVAMLLSVVIFVSCCSY